ncbi:MAG: hypothetical protein AAB798_02125 [Patescibacteria group bacterium]
MLSFFPEILFLAPLSATLIRVALGVAFGYAAWKHLNTADALERTLGVAEGATALALIAGAWTQPAAILSIVIFFIHTAIPRLRVLPASTALLLLVMCVSLLLTGAGALAFDLPL